MKGKHGGKQKHRSKLKGVEGVKKAKLEEKKQAQLDEQKEAKLEAKIKAMLEGKKGAKLEGKKEAKLEEKKKAKLEEEKKAKLEAKEAKLEAKAAKRKGRQQLMEPEPTHEAPLNQKKPRPEWRPKRRAATGTAATGELKGEPRPTGARRQGGQTAASTDDVAAGQASVALVGSAEEVPDKLAMTIPPPEQMEIRYCHTRSEVEAAAMEVLSFVPADGSSLVIGFDMEWEFKPVEKPAALMQLCVHLEGQTTEAGASLVCYLLHLARLGASAEERMPPALGQLLQHPKVILATVGDADERKLVEEHHLQQHRLVQINRIHHNIELLKRHNSSRQEACDAFKRLSKDSRKYFRCSLQAMLKEHMGRDISKEFQQANDAWERDGELSAELVRYAATDAFTQLLLFHAVQQSWVREKEILGIHEPLSLEDIIIG